MKINKFRTAAAKVKDNAAVIRQGVNNAEITYVGFRIAGNDMQADAGFLLHKARQFCAVAGIADGGSSHGNGSVCMVKPAHIGKTFHCFDGIGKCLRR